jgi:hypothetical protein
MATTTKVTANLPKEEPSRARAITGQGITKTLVEGLRALDRENARRSLRALRGKVEIHVDLARTRR